MNDKRRKIKTTKMKITKIKNDRHFDRIPICFSSL